MMLTIFTPTYNRADFLPRLYDSLLKQGSTDLEWLIVDDGSTDDTATVVRSFLDEGKLCIRYVKKENGGKHSAYNCGLENAHGEWFLCVDADDFLHKDALTHIANAITHADKDTALIAYKQSVRGTLLSDEFPRNIDRCRISDLSLRHSCQGEFSLVFPTAVARKFKFPIFQGEKFVGESVIYDRYDREHSVLLLPEVITVCEYQPDGYSSNFSKLMKQNPNGFCLYFLQRIDLQTRLLPRLVHAGKYWCFRWISGNADLVYEGKHRVLVFLAMLPGIAFRIYYKLFRNI